MSISRRASRPTTKKKNVMRPLLTQPRRSWLSTWPPSRNDSVVVQTSSYDDVSMFTQTRAATAAVSSTAALLVSVRRKTCNGVRRRDDQTVRSVSVTGEVLRAQNLSAERPTGVGHLR